MTEILFPSQLKHARSKFRYVDATGLVRGAYTGAVQTTAYGGDRFGASIDTSPVGGLSGQADRAVLIAWLATLKGKQNRAWIWDQSYTQRGSFPSSELISNNTFANGTTGWTATAQHTLSVMDRVLRVQRAQVSASASISSTALTGLNQYAPYVSRVFFGTAWGASSVRAGLVDAYDGAILAPAISPTGLSVISWVLNGTTATPLINDGNATGVLAGNYFSVKYASFTRCLLVDNGSNLLIKSDQLDDAAWVKTNSTSTANAVTAPDGTVTGDTLNENTTNGVHQFSQAVTVGSSAVDYCFSVAVAPSSRSWVQLILQEGGGSTNAGAYFDVTNGLVGTTSAAGNWANIRAFISPLGNTWYACTVVARKTNAATTVSGLILAATANGNNSYAGVGTNSAVSLWRATLSQSSVPSRLIQTTTAAVPATAQTGGALYVKGLPASTNGLLLVGDIVQSANQPLMVTAPLNSDAGGLGYLQFSPPLRASPSDSDPIIVNQPMGKFIFTGTFPEWENVPGIFTTASLDFEESCD